MSRAELQQYPAEAIVRIADRITTLTINLDDALNALGQLGDRENGIHGFVWLLKRGLIDIENLALQVHDDAQQRAVDSAEMERIACAHVEPVETKRKARS